MHIVVLLKQSLSHQLNQMSLNLQTSGHLMKNSISLVMLKMKFYATNPMKNVMKSLVLYLHQQSYHHMTCQHTCIMLTLNLIFKILNTIICWIVKKFNIWWKPYLKGCVLKPNKKFNMLCNSIIWIKKLITIPNYQIQQS